MTRTNASCLLVVLATLLSLAPDAATQDRPRARRTPEGVKAWRNLEYSRANGKPLHLDLFRAAEVERKVPLVIWIHGGGWRKGSKENNPALFLISKGYAVASINYRLTPQARFPAQIHDCKAAVRWLRSSSSVHGTAHIR